MDIKAYLKSGPVDVEYVSHDPTPQNKVSKANKPYTVYKYTFRLRSTGETFNSNLFESDHKSIGYVGPNALIRIYMKDNGYEGYTVLPSGEAGLNVPQPPNGQQVQKERNMTKEIQEKSLADKSLQKQISLAGVYQARLAAGQETAKARAEAIDDVAWLERTGLNLAMAPDKKDFAPETPPLHTPSVTIAEVDAAFGQ